MDVAQIEDDCMRSWRWNGYRSIDMSWDVYIREYSSMV